MPVPSAHARARSLIWERDGYACGYCGRTVVKGNRSVDHVVPIGAGGASTPGNLITSCFSCNRSKYNRRLDPGLEETILALCAHRSLSLPWPDQFTKAFRSAWRYADYGVRKRRS